MTGSAEHPPLWSLRDVRIVVPARAVSVMGDSILTIVLLLYVQQTGAGAWAVAAVLAAASLPIVLLMGIAGRIADTYDSRHILVVTTSLQVLACIALAFVRPLVGIVLLALVVQTGQAVVGPTWSALTPRIVGEDGIGRLVAMQSGLTALAAPAGAAIGGVLFGLAGIRTAVLVDAATFAILACAAAAVRTRRDVGVAEPQSAESSDADDHVSTAGGAHNQSAGSVHSEPQSAKATTGFGVLRSDPIVWPMAWALFAAIVTVGGVNVVDVFLVRESLHTSATLYGLSEVVAAIGGVAGSVVAARVASDRSRARFTLAGFVLTGLACIGAGRSPDFVLYLCCAAIIGLANTTANATFAALFIRRVPDIHRGKAAATLNGLAQIGMVAALVLGGAGGWALGPRMTFVAAGVTAVLAGAMAGVVVMKHIRELQSEPAGK